MSDRQTYSERRSYSTRVMKWRKAVYAERPDMTNGCRVLLLRLSDDMDSHRKVSVPRSILATDLGVAPARITEWIAKAKSLGFLDVVRRGRPGVTAVYAGTMPPHVVRPSVPSETPGDGTPEPTKHVVRPGVPQSEPAWYALGGTQEVVPAAGIDTAPGTHRHDVRSKERACEWCGSVVCDRECLAERAQTASRRIG